MPHRTLQVDGTVQEGFAQREVIDALHKPTGNKEPLIAVSLAGNDQAITEGETPPLKVSEPYGGPLISSAAGSPAKTSQSPDADQGSRANDQDCSSSSHESLTLFSPMADGASLRTYPDYFPPKADEISPSYSRRWPTSGFTTSPGECWTADTSECPSEGAGFSSLQDVLLAEVHPRFYLSQRAAAGILRRAEKRGKNLPSHLEAALDAVAGGTISTTQPTQSTSEDERKARGPNLTTSQAFEPQAEEAAEATSPTLSDQKASTPQRTAPGAVRRLSPTECERLQGFPDGWTIPNPTDLDTQPAGMLSRSTSQSGSGGG